MAKLPAPRQGRKSDQVLMRIGVGVLAVVVAIIVVNMIISWIFGAIFALVRIVILLGLLGIVAWFVLIGPPGMDDG
jgi:hypothetical protein